MHAGKQARSPGNLINFQSITVLWALFQDILIVEPYKAINLVYIFSVVK